MNFKTVREVNTAKKYMNAVRVALTLMVAFLMAACTDFDESGSGGKKKPKPEDGEAFVALDFNITRNYNPSTGQDYDEYSVGSVRMVLYGTDEENPTNSDYVVLKVFDFLIKSKGENERGFEEWGDSGSGDYTQDYIDSGYPKGEHLYWSAASSSADQGDFITYARAVPRRDYKMLMILNVPTGSSDDDNTVTRGLTRAEIKNVNLRAITQPGRTLADLLDAGELDYQVASPDNVLISKLGHIMTNSMGLVDVPASALGTSVDNAHQNPIRVSVDRTLAKLSVKLETGVDPASWEVSQNMKVQSIRWDVLRQNRRFYWMRKQTYVIENSGIPVMTETAMYPDPYSNSAIIYRDALYAEDPNFAGISGNAQRVAENIMFHRYVDSPFEYSATGQIDQTATLIWDDSGYSSDDDVRYILENTMAAGEQYEDVMTTVVAGVRFIPNGLYQDNVTLTGFFIYNDVIFDCFQLYRYYHNIDPLPSTLSGVIEATTKALSMTHYVEGFGDDNYLYDAATWNYETSRNEDAICGYTVGFDVDGLRFYSGGWSYYLIPILHYRDYSISGEGLRFAFGRYGVVRNNDYNIFITGIKALGPPEVTTGGYLSAEIGIMDWSQHGLGVELGGGVDPVVPKPPLPTIYIYHVTPNRDMFGEYKIIDKTVYPYKYKENEFVDLAELALDPFSDEFGKWVGNQGYRYSNSDTAVTGEYLTEEIDYFWPDWDDTEYNPENDHDLIRVKGYDDNGEHKIYHFVIYYDYLPT